MSKNKNKIKSLQKRVSELEKIIQSDRIILQDAVDPNIKLILSIEQGQYKLVKQVTTINIQPIENQ